MVVCPRRGHHDGAIDLFVGCCDTFGLLFVGRCDTFGLIIMALDTVGDVLVFGKSLQFSLEGYVVGKLVFTGLGVGVYDVIFLVDGVDQGLGKLVLVKVLKDYSQLMHQ